MILILQGVTWQVLFFFTEGELAALIHCRSPHLDDFMFQKGITEAASTFSLPCCLCYTLSDSWLTQAASYPCQGKNCGEDVKQVSAQFLTRFPPFKNYDLWLQVLSLICIKNSNAVAIIF